jgi:hypothetical protein
MPKHICRTFELQAKIEHGPAADRVAKVAGHETAERPRHKT